MTDLIPRLERTIKERRLFRPGELTVVAVSGGLDSAVLLHVLHRFAQKEPWKLVVAHFNHQLRGRASDADERFVRKVAERLGIPCVAGRRNVKRFARKNGLSLEMAARHLRHDFLARTALAQRATKVALGHHADDQVELFFLRLLRGAGVEGLAGMKWSSPSPADPKVTLVRPLLRCSRAALEQFALQERIAFREDSTNRTMDFLRNRIRHELLPLLQKSYQPALTKTTLRLMDVLAGESEFVNKAAQSWLKKKTPAFDSLPVAIQRRSLQMQLFRLGQKADFDTVEHLRLNQGIPLTIRPGLAVQRDNAGTVRNRHQKKVQFQRNLVDLKLKTGPGAIKFRGLKVSWSMTPRRPAEHIVRSRTPATKSGHEMFDADKVGATIALRHWLPGDRFHPIGMPGNIKLQDLFSNQKIPRSRRHELVVAVAANGELFWVQGLRISEQFKLDKSTKRKLNWHWQAS